ncbi:hypothetical protein ACIO8H_35825 [Streptomyces sp. NPDC087226]|jgi:hypothetical protein|uniref:hypothetical protein n=1 Tax=Streptomyces sp. NPDC087226 TaxID=3365771 RepID=UPI0037FD301B
MKSVQSNIFTRSPGRFLEDVFRGETLLVTRYGRPYVLISPPPADPPAPDEAEGSR